MSKQQRIQVGDRIIYDDHDCRVEAIVASDERDGTIIARLRGDDGRIYAVDAMALAHEARPELPPEAEVQDTAMLVLEGLPEHAREEALQWRADLLEIATGYRSGHQSTAQPGEPRVKYHAEHTMRSKVAAKAEELGVSQRKVWRKWQQWQEKGIRGLVDERKTRLSNPLADVDERLVETIRQVGAAETTDSTGTLGRLRRRVQRRLDEQYGDGEVQVPSERTFNKYVGLILPGRYTTGQATTRRNTATQPQRTFAPVPATRPGEQVQFDSTPLDVRAWDPETDETYAVELTYAIDVCTRSIPAWRLTPPGTKSVDAALLLADMLLPEPMRPSWPDVVKLSTLQIPYERLVGLDERLEYAAARPLIVPESISIDHGKVFTSTAFHNACERLGISLQLTRKAQPTDKPHVERGFGTIRTQFAQHVAGYKGPNVVHRGKNPDERARWTLSELEEFLAEYILVVYQRRRHEGLKLSGHPDITLSPNEAYAEAVARAGYVHMPVDSDLYFELLPTEWAVIRPNGLKVRTLRYDSNVLHKYRNIASPYRYKGGKWPVKFDPRDRNHVYWQDPETASWHAIRWVHAVDDQRPFTDRTLEYVKRAMVERGYHPATEQEVAEQLHDLQNRMDTPADLAPKERRRAIRDAERGRAAQRDHDRPDRRATQVPPAAQAEPAEEDAEVVELDQLEAFDVFSADDVGGAR